MSTDTTDRDPERGDPMNHEQGDDDAGGMPDEFVDTPLNEPGDQGDPPQTVADRANEVRR
jgi:hypothetical protein